MDKVWNALDQAITQFNSLRLVEENGLFQYPNPLLLAELEAVVSKLPRGGTVIDIGTAAGILPHTLHILGYKVISIDQSINGKPTWGMKRAKDAGIQTIMSTVGKEKINLPTGMADVIFAGDVIEHLPDSPRPFMAEVSRLLKSKGWCILTTPNAVRLPVRIKVMLGHSNWMPLKEFYHHELNLGHHKEYVIEELNELLEWSHFDNISCEFVEDTLKRAGIASSFSDIKTRNRHIGKQKAITKFEIFNYMEYLRLLSIGITAIWPSLRSSIICQSQRQ